MPVYGGRSNFHLHLIVLDDRFFDLLELKTVGRLRPSPLVYAGAVVGLFLAGYLGGRATGNWSNEIGDREYVERIQNIHSGDYSHPGR